jgi:hypothetical protein
MRFLQSAMSRSAWASTSSVIALSPFGIRWSISVWHREPSALLLV